VPQQTAPPAACIFHTVQFYFQIPPKPVTYDSRLQLAVNQVALRSHTGTFCTVPQNHKIFQAISIPPIAIFPPAACEPANNHWCGPFVTKFSDTYGIRVDPLIKNRLHQ
jgi:hypothetical protein